MWNNCAEMQIGAYREKKEALREQEMRERLTVERSAEDMLFRISSLGGLNTAERSAYRRAGAEQKTAV